MLDSSLPVTLDGLLNELVDDVGDVTTSGPGFARNGVVFAARSGADAIELRLGVDIAEAAMGTADTTRSPRGDDWVLLDPRDWRGARDRLDAWFRVAWRFAGKSR